MIENDPDGTVSTHENHVALLGNRVGDPTPLLAMLAMFVFSAGCATAPFPPRDATIEQRYANVDRVTRRLRAELPFRERFRVQYRVWSSPGTDKPEFRNEDGVVYINKKMLELTDDALAFGIGHEIYHVLRHRGLSELAVAGQTGLSVGAGVAAGYYTTWWIGSLVGCGAWGLLFPPLILAGSRAGETSADLFAIDLVARAGYNADGAADTWCALLLEHDRDVARAGDDPTTWNRTHPSATERCVAIQEARRTRDR